MRAPLFAIQSYYSLLRGPVSIDRWCQAAVDLGYESVALADVNSLAGAVEFFQTAHTAGLHPILGVQILTDQAHLILLAESDQGYSNLCSIVSAQNLDPNFNLPDQLAAHHEGLIAMGAQPCLLEQLKTLLPGDSLFAFPDTHPDIRPMAYGRFNTLTPEDQHTGQVLQRIRTLRTIGPGPACAGQPWQAPPKERTWTHQWQRSRPGALHHAHEVAGRCRFDLLHRGICFPRPMQTRYKDTRKELAQWCLRGLAARYGTLSQDVMKRLNMELQVIHDNGFTDYFLTVREIISFAMQQDIPVGVRGSAAGSLVSYVLGWTHVCPMEHSLYFERFLNPGRTDCPDIDIDFCWRRRDEVIRFCYDHWGHDRVAMVCNINRFRRRGGIRDVARALGYPPEQINDVVRKPATYPKVHAMAQALAGVPRHLSVHCGGIVMTPDPIARRIPLTWTAKGVIVTQYDKRTIEPAGLVKIDLLSNRSLSTVHDAIEIISQSKGTVDGLNNPADDKVTALLGRGDSLGVFQSESPGMRQLLQGLKVQNPKELAIALSLIRPGPASGGMKAEFIQRHVHHKPFEYLHPSLKPLLQDTYGIMLYQEDVMRIAVDMAGYSVAEADRFRSEVSKKVSSTRVEAQYREFVYHRSGRHGLDRHTAEQMWEQILQFAAYSFCKAHATVYARIAWHTAWLKAHHPLAFYWALFNNHHGMYPLRVYVWDAIRHGIGVLPPHVNHSDSLWTLEGKRIRTPLSRIRGLCHDTVTTLVSEQKKRPFDTLNDLRTRVTFRKGQLEPLIEVGACDGLGLTRPTMLAQLEYPVPNLHQPLLFDLQPPVRSGPEFTRIQKLEAELAYLGIPFSLHPELLIHTRHIPATALPDFINRNVTVAGFIAAARRARTQDNRIMGFITLEDSTGLTEINFFPDKIDLYQRLVRCSGPIWIQGRVTRHLSSITLECQTCGEAA
ncbi:MAG: PHP domain-containing protein [Phycisphaerae bacterium]|nr:PHP domain-containing protein [Phycisphaerae bacterium]